MKNSRETSNSESNFLVGGILAIIGLIGLLEGQWLGGLFLLGLGVVFTASINEEFRKEFFGFIFSMFKGLWKMLSHSD